MKRGLADVQNASFAGRRVPEFMRNDICEIIDEVVDAVTSWRSIFDSYEVPKADVSRLDGSIIMRLDRLGK